METISRLKLKVGPHEFEAEGPPQFVQDQFNTWKEMTTTASALIVTSPQTDSLQSDFKPPATPPAPDLASVDSSLGKIMRVEHRVISLTARPGSPEEAVILLLYGQRVLRENDSVTGGEIILGLSRTGGLAISRVDRLLEKVGRDGDVIVIGERRSKRYRLTNTGLTKARQLATSLLAMVA